MITTTTTTRFAIFIVETQRYNEGQSYNCGWLNVTNIEETTKAIQAIVGEKFYTIHDYEFFSTPSANLNEFSSIEDLVNLNELIISYGETAVKVYNYFFGDMEETRQYLQKQYIGNYKSLCEYAENKYSDLLAMTPKPLCDYIDFEEIALDEVRGGYTNYFELENDTIAVFKVPHAS